MVALYNEAQTLPQPDMYGKNLTFKTRGADGCSCREILRLIAGGKLDTVPLIPHTYPLKDIAEVYELFEKRGMGSSKQRLIAADLPIRDQPNQNTAGGMFYAQEFWSKALDLSAAGLYPRHLWRGWHA